LGRNRLFSRPFVYRVDPSTACNLRCPGCEAHSQPTDELRLLSLKTFERILSEIKRFGVRLSLYDTGEPLVNANLFEMVARGTDVGMATMVNTNLTLFRDHHLEPLRHSGLSVLSASVDGHTQSDYAQYRKRGHIEDVLKALRSIVDMKKNTDKAPLLEIQVIDFKHLRSKKKNILRFFKELGADRVVWKRETWGFNEEEREVKAGRRCFWLYTGAMIRPDGKLYPCCGRGFDRLPYGDLKRQTIKEIWNNPFYQFSRSLFVKGPDLPYAHDMKNVPCLSCDLFEKKRVMSPPPTFDRRIDVVSIA